MLKRVAIFLKKLSIALCTMEHMLQADLFYSETVKKINGKNAVREARNWKRVNYLKFVLL